MKRPPLIASLIFVLAAAPLCANEPTATKDESASLSAQVGQSWDPFSSNRAITVRHLHLGKEVHAFAVRGHGVDTAYTDSRCVLGFSLNASSGNLILRYNFNFTPESEGLPNLLVSSLKVIEGEPLEVWSSGGNSLSIQVDPIAPVRTTQASPSK